MSSTESDPDEAITKEEITGTAEPAAQVAQPVQPRNACKSKLVTTARCNPKPKHLS